MVMNLPGAISPQTTSFAAARKSPGSGCSRASERKTNFAIAMSAAASIPCPVTSPSTTASRPSASVEEVVDVAAHVDAGRRLVDVADLDPGQLGRGARQQRALHRVGELLLLLVQPRVVDRERGLAGDREGEIDGRGRDRARRVERDELSVPSSSAGVAIGSTTAVEPFSRKGTSSA